jgi:hypothetical protein
MNFASVVVLAPRSKRNSCRDCMIRELNPSGGDNNPIGAAACKSLCRKG